MLSERTSKLYGLQFAMPPAPWKRGKQILSLRGVAQLHLDLFGSALVLTRQQTPKIQPKSCSQLPCPGSQGTMLSSVVLPLIREQSNCSWPRSPVNCFPLCAGMGEQRAVVLPAPWQPALPVRHRQGMCRGHPGRLSLPYSLEWVHGATLPCISRKHLANISKALRQKLANHCLFILMGKADSI